MKRLVSGLLLVLSLLGVVLCGGSLECYASAEIPMTKVAEYALSWDGCKEIPYAYNGWGRSLSSLEECKEKNAPVDCSGFCMFVYKHCGLSLPSSSREIAANALEKFTDESKAVPGDICWWNGHVAVYVGNGKIMHTNTDKGPYNYPHVSQISGEGANYQFPTYFCRMVEDVQDLQPISDVEVDEVVEEVEEAIPYGSIITESDLDGMVIEDFLVTEQHRLEMMDRRLLSTAEIANLEEIKAYFAAKDNVLLWYQVLQSFLGIVCIFYGVLLVLAYVLDYSNVFIEFSLLAVVTFGKFRILDAKELAGVNKWYYTGWKKGRGVCYLTVGMLAVRVVMLLALGAVLISGIIGESLVNLIMFSKEAFGLG